MSAGTKAIFSNHEGHSKGLFICHVYAIVGYRIGRVILPDNTLRKLRFILVKNPHGMNIRHYKWKLKDGSYVLSAYQGNEAALDQNWQSKVYGDLHFQVGSIVKYISVDVRSDHAGVCAIELEDFFKKFHYVCKTISIREYLVKHRSSQRSGIGY